MKTKILAMVWVVLGVAAVLAARDVGKMESSPAGPDIDKTATAYLRVNSEKPHLLDRAPQPFSEKQFELYKETQRQLVKMRFVLQAALRKPQVAMLPSVAAAQRDGDSVRWLSDHLNITFPGNAEIMAVACTVPDRHAAAVLVNAVVEAYLVEVVNVDRNQERRGVAELERLCAAKEQDIRTHLQQLRVLGYGGEIAGPEGLVSLRRLQIGEAAQSLADVAKDEAELTKLDRELASRKALLNSLDGTNQPADASRDGRAAIKSEIDRLQGVIATAKEVLTRSKKEAMEKRSEVEKLFRSPPVDIQMMQLELKSFDDTLHELNVELERAKIELRAPPRVTLVEKAEESVIKD